MNQLARLQNILRVLRGKHYYLGLYSTKEEAYFAYCEKARELHGEFARF